MNQHKNNESGYTLVEITIAAVLLSIIIGISLLFANTMLRDTDSKFREIDLEEQMNRTTEDLVRKFQESSSSLTVTHQYGGFSVVVMPTPRNQFGRIAGYETNEDGEITSIGTAPQWQGYLIIWVNDQGQLWVYEDRREGHTFTTTPTLPYPDDWNDRTEEYLYYCDGSRNSDGTLIEWEIPRNPAECSDYEGLRSVRLTSHLIAFNATLTGSNLRISMTGRRQTGTNRLVTVSYNDSTTARNRN